VGPSSLRKSLPSASCSLQMQRRFFKKGIVCDARYSPFLLQLEVTEQSPCRRYSPPPLWNQRQVRFFHRLQTTRPPSFKLGKASSLLRGVKIDVATSLSPPPPPHLLLLSTCAQWRLSKEAMSLIKSSFPIIYGGGAPLNQRQ